MSPLQGFGVKKWRTEYFRLAQMIECQHKEPQAAGSIPASDSGNSCASKMYPVTTVCFLWFIVRNFALSWNWLFFSSSSAKNSCSDWTVQSVFAKFGNLVESYAKRWRCEARDYWPNGGAVALDWKFKLWTHVADEPYDRQRWHSYTLMRLLVPNDFRVLTFGLWCLDQLISLIIW